MNKKILAGLMAIIMVLAFVLVGCSKRPKDPSTDQFAQGGVGVEDWDENEGGGVGEWDDNESNSSSSGNKDDNNGGGNPEDRDDDENSGNSSSGSGSSSSSSKHSSSKPSSSNSSSGSQSNSQSSSGSSSSSSGNNKTMTYEEFQALSKAEQQAYCESFDSFMDYVAWYNKAKAEKEYKDKQDSTRIEGGDSFDISDYIKK